MEIAILIIAYDRPKCLFQIIEVLKTIRPTNLYISIDGTKPNSKDSDNIASTKALVDSIDWPCVIKKKYELTNLGCAKAVTSAIDWAFENEEKLIILEEDVLPTKAFFKFMKMCLHEYQDEKSIFGIGGYNGVLSNIESVSSCESILTTYPSIWGWATWKDRWEKYDVNIFNFRISVIKVLKSNNYNFLMAFYYLFNFYKIRHGRLNTWDYQLTYLCFINKYNFIIPKDALVTNVGFDSSSLHTKNKIKMRVAVESIINQVKPPHSEPGFDRKYRKKRVLDLICILFRQSAKIKIFFTKLFLK